MNLEQELVVSGGMSPEVAIAMAFMPDVQVMNPMRWKLLDLHPESMVVMCIGRVLEFEDMHCKHKEEPRRMIVNEFSPGRTFLCEQLTGALRAHALHTRLVVSASEWKRSSVLREHALRVATKHGADMAARVKAFGFATCRERLVFLRDVLRIDLTKWSKTELAAWAGMSREMVSRMVQNGEIVDGPAKE